MHVRTLGRAELSANGTRLGPEAKVAFPLLLHLVLERDHWVARTQLQEMLFPEQDRLHARHSLRQSVYTLRKEGFPIEGSGPALHIPAKGIVDDYSTLLTPQLEGERELAELMGGWLAGFEPTISKAYSHWFEGKRGEVALGMRSTLLAELAVHKRNARWGQCERTCRAILTLDPLNEEATLGLAEALALTGAKVQAIRILERYQEEMPNADLQLPAAVLRRRISEAPAAAAPLNECPLIGRSQEFQQITHSIAGSAHAPGETIVLTGEAGIGKTRLLNEAANWARLSGLAVATHVCHPYDHLRPLGVIAALVPQLKGFPGALGCAPDAFALLERLQMLPKLSDHGAEGNRDIDALMAWAFEELVAAVTSEKALLLAIDDFHWADDASAAALCRLTSRRVPHFAALLASRALPTHLRTSDPSHIREISLPRLGAKAARDMLTSLLHGSIKAAAPNVATLHSVAFGNPFYLHILARHLRANPIGSDVPLELADLIEKHLLELTDIESGVLAAVCVLGRHATFSHLEELLSLPRHALLQCLSRLESRGFTSISDGIVRPEHPLLAETALRRLPDTARQYLYFTAAGTLEKSASHSEDPSLLWDTVALARQCGANANVLRTARQCVQQAMSFGHASAACDILLDVKTYSLSAEEQDATLRELLHCAATAGRWALVADITGRLLSKASHLRPEELSTFRWLATEADWHRSHAHDELSSRLLLHLRDTNLTDAIRLQIADILEICASNTGNGEHASEAAAFAKTFLESHSDSAQALQVLTVFEATFGELSNARAFSELILAKDHYPPSQLTLRLRMNAASCLRFAGGTDEAISALESAFADAEKFGFTGNAYAIANELAFSFLIQGESQSAAPWLQKAEGLLPMCAEHVDPYILLEGKSALAILTGQHDVALAVAEDLCRSAVRRPRRIREFVRSLRWQASVRAGGPAPPPEELESIRAVHLEFRHHLESDFHTLAVVELLHSGGRSADAALLLRKYLGEVRRERSPALPLLRSLSEDFDENGMASPEALGG